MWTLVLIWYIGGWQHPSIEHFVFRTVAACERRLSAEMEVAGDPRWAPVGFRGVIGGCFLVAPVPVVPVSPVASGSPRA